MCVAEMAANDDDKTVPLTFMMRIAEKLKTRVEVCENKLHDVTNTIRQRNNRIKERA